MTLEIVGNNQHISWSGTWSRREAILYADELLFEENEFEFENHEEVCTKGLVNKIKYWLITTYKHISLDPYVWVLQISSDR